MAVEVKIEKDSKENRVFISAHGQIVDVHVTDDGISVQITKGNEVLAEASSDAD